MSAELESSHCRTDELLNKSSFNSCHGSTPNSKARARTSTVARNPDILALPEPRLDTRINNQIKKKNAVERRENNLKGFRDLYPSQGQNLALALSCMCSIRSAAVRSRVLTGTRAAKLRQPGSVQTASRQQDQLEKKGPPFKSGARTGTRATPPRPSPSTN